jgi:hypothetical protein
MSDHRIVLHEDDPHSRYAGTLLTRLGYETSAPRTPPRDAVAVFGASGEYGPRLLLTQGRGEDSFAHAGIEVPSWARGVERLVAVNQLSVSELKRAHEDDLASQLGDAVELLGARRKASIPE